MVVYMKEKLDLKRDFLNPFFLKLKGGLYEQKFVIIHERSVS